MLFTRGHVLKPTNVLPSAHLLFLWQFDWSFLRVLSAATSRVNCVPLEVLHTRFLEFGDLELLHETSVIAIQHDVVQLGAPDNPHSKASLTLRCQ